MPPKKSSTSPEKKTLLGQRAATPSIKRPSNREPFPEDANRESQSGMLLPWLVALVVLEWMFLLGVFTAGLWLWTDWQLLSWAPLVWLHAGLLLSISLIRQFGQWAYAFLPQLHTAVIGLALIDTLVLASFLTASEVNLHGGDSMAKLVCLVVFTLFGWMRVGLVLFCTLPCCGCCTSRRGGSSTISV